VSGAVAGNFANRNHFALFLAIGVVLAMAWAFRDETLPWKIAVAFGMVVLFILMVLATGSRSGVIVGLAGIVLTFLAFRRRAAQQFKAIPRKIAVPIVFVAIAVLIGAIWLSVGLDRAVSVDRATMLDGQADLRSQIWPIVLEMSQRYFPAGTGFGTFDPVFRIAEPDGLLSPQYINLAHNDWLQLFLEGGLVAGILIAAVLVWYLLKSLRAWSAADANRGARVLAKVGTILIALILAASVTDYPSRTPMVMAILMLASAWLVAPGSKKADTVPTQPSSS